MPDDLPTLPHGELAPAFELGDRNGVRVTRSQFRGRRFLALLFFAPDAAPTALLAVLVSEYERLEWLEADVLAIIPTDPSNLPPDHPPLRHLADPALTATRRFTTVTGQVPRTTVVVLDRYGAVEQRWIEPELPTTQEVINLLERLAHTCSG